MPYHGQTETLGSVPAHTGEDELFVTVTDWGTAETFDKTLLVAGA